VVVKCLRLGHGQELRLKTTSILLIADIVSQTQGITDCIVYDEKIHIYSDTCSHHLNYGTYSKHDFKSPIGLGQLQDVWNDDDIELVASRPMMSRYVDLTSIACE
jgi:hypothetical protein